jgi:tetraacyldisaccharide 4'-kinase
MATYLSQFLNRLWYGNTRWSKFLLPASTIYKAVTILRRWYLKRYCQQTFSVPVIVVGNLTVGGVGKTPLVIAIAQRLTSQGLRVGIVSRGYGAKIKRFPHEVNLNETADLVGDEPLLLAKKTHCPVVIAPRRVQAVKHLLKKHPIQVILSDDGLQHYAMGRAIEIVVVDGLRGFGNNHCLPAGPLREPLARLQAADFVIINGSLQEFDSIGMLMTSQCAPIYRMDFQVGNIRQLINGEPKPLNQWIYPIAAVAGIGNPQRFFATLKSLGMTFNAYPFPDHHVFRPEELFFNEKMIVMTEKDAVKCYPFATDAMYFLPIEASICDNFWTALWSHKQLQGSI